MSNRKVVIIAITITTITLLATIVPSITILSLQLF